MDSKQLREAFASRIAKEVGVRSAGLVDGLTTVPREDFVGSGPWQIMRPGKALEGYFQTPDSDLAHIYDDVLVALDATRGLNNGQPSALVHWLDDLDLGLGDRFLHVGCGVGYYTAIAGVAVGPKGSVIGIEVDPGLAQQAASLLKRYENVEVLLGDGLSELPGRFDAIFVNAGCTHPPSHWLDHMAVGGRMLIPLTVASRLENIGGGQMLFVTRRDESQYDAKFTGTVGIFHCEGARDSEANDLLARAYSGKDSHVVRRLRRDTHAIDDACWLHGPEYCLSR